MPIWIDVKALRQNRGWLQREAAEKLGITRAYLSSIENYRRDISTNMLESVIRVFGVKFEDFSTSARRRRKKRVGQTRA